MIHRITVPNYMRAMRVFTDQLWYSPQTVVEAGLIIDAYDSGATFPQAQKPFHPARLRKMREPRITIHPIKGKR